MGLSLSRRDVVLRGLKCRCPFCGKGKIFYKFLLPNKSCEVCCSSFKNANTDDGPIFIVGLFISFLIVFCAVIVEIYFRPSMVFHFILWPTLTILLSLLILQPVKGAWLAFQIFYSIDQHQ